MSEEHLADAFARLDRHRNLHLPLRRSDLLGRLIIRFLWKRQLKWQIETNIAIRDALGDIQESLHGIREEIAGLRAKIVPIHESLGDGTGLATNVGVGKEFDDLRRADKNLAAGLNQRIYAAVGGLRSELSDLRLSVASTDQPDLRKRLDGLAEQLTSVAVDARDLRLRYSRLDTVLGPATSEQPPSPPAADHAAFIELAVSGLLEGPVELTTTRREPYLPIVEQARGRQATGEAFDMLPGRGEWLTVLRTAGIPVRAASANPYVVKHCGTLGFELIEHDPLDTLRTTTHGTLAAVTAFRYVERLDPATQLRFVEAAASALRPGGVLIVETPHAAGAGARDFHLDPFARSPIHPGFLRFLAESAGFDKAEIRYVHDGPLAGWPADAAASSADKADRYCLIAWR